MAKSQADFFIEPAGHKAHNQGFQYINTYQYRDNIEQRPITNIHPFSRS